MLLILSIICDHTPYSEHKESSGEHTLAGAECRYCWSAQRVVCGCHAQGHVRHRYGHRRARLNHSPCLHFSYWSGRDQTSHPSITRPNPSYKKAMASLQICTTCKDVKYFIHNCQTEWTSEWKFIMDDSFKAVLSQFKHKTIKVFHFAHAYFPYCCCAFLEGQKQQKKTVCEGDFLNSCHQIQLQNRWPWQTWWLKETGGQRLTVSAQTTWHSILRM